MSAAKEAKVYVTRDARRPAWMRWVFRGLIVLIAVLVVATGVKVVYDLLYPPTPQAVQSAMDAANLSVAAGDYQQAIVEWNKALSSAKSKQNKVTIYDGLATAYTSTGNVDQALHYYQLKHVLAPNTTKVDAYLVGSLYDRKGDKKNALSYYNLALQYYKTLQQTSQMKNQVQSLQAQIQELEGQ